MVKTADKNEVYQLVCKTFNLNATQKEKVQGPQQDTLLPLRKESYGHIYRASHPPLGVTEWSMKEVVLRSTQKLQHCVCVYLPIDFIHKGILQLDILLSLDHYSNTYTLG